MRYWVFVILYIIIILSKNAAGQDSLLLHDFKYCVETLASDSMKGREPGTKGAEMAADFVRKEFEKRGLTVYTQSFCFMGPDKDSIRTENILGWIDNGQEETIIIAAHYDHLGMGNTHYSREVIKKNKIHNGADDNASGVAMMLALSQKIKKDTAAKFNYLFLAFSGHEYGLWGAEYYTLHPFVPLEKTRFLMNFDMVGRLDKASRILKIYGKDICHDAELLTEDIPADSLHIIVNLSDSPPLDYSAFVRKGVQSLSFTTGVHNDYHKSTDDASRINYLGMRYIYEYCLLLLNKVKKK